MSLKNRVIFMILLILSLLIGPLEVYAQEYKIEDIESNFKKIVPSEEDDSDQESYKDFIDKIVTTVEGNNILITAEGEENINFKWTITLENDIL